MRCDGDALFGFDGSLRGYAIEMLQEGGYFVAEGCNILVHCFGFAEYAGKLLRDAVSLLLEAVECGHDAIGIVVFVA